MAEKEKNFLFVFYLHYCFRRVVFLFRRVYEVLRLDPNSDGQDDNRIKNLLRISLLDAGYETEFGIDFLLAEEIDAWLSADIQGMGQPKSDPQFEVWLDGFCNELEWIKKNILTPRLNRLRA